MANLKSPAFVLILFLSVVLKAVAQPTSGSLAIGRENGISLSQIIQQLAASKPDTNRVNLLISQSHLYWIAKTNQNNLLDSSRMAAENALDLSSRLRFIKGSNEANFMICRTAIEKGDITSAVSIASKVYGEERARLLLIISEHFVFAWKSPEQIDKGYPFIIAAINTSKAAGSSSWYYQGLLLLGKYYFIKGDIARGKEAIVKIIKSCEQLSDVANEAHYWSELGTYMPKTDNNLYDVINSHAMAVKYYLLAGNKREAAYSLRDKATAERGNNIDMAEKDGLKAISMLDSLKVPLSYSTCAMMADIYQQKSDFTKALKYTIASVTSTGPVSTKNKWGANATLAIIYDELGQPKKALEYQKLAFDYAVSINSREMYFWAYRLVEDQIKTGETKKGLTQLTAFTNKFKPVMASHKQLMAAAYGDLYFALNDPKKAEGYYLEMIKQDKEAILENAKILRSYNSIIGTEAFHKIGGFYIERKQYAVARPYLLKALPKSSTIDERSQIEFLLFKADSALGKFESAISYFEHSKNAKDSIFSITKSKQIAELDIKYRTEQRQKAFLTLENKSILQNQDIERGHLERNITLAGIGTLLVVSALVYNGYRNKKKSNIALEAKQREINHQNSTLQTLVEEKDGLLTEKDWLLKEVHHRVKNNLQIVMSLLSSQSAYLENSVAIEAIRESQNRVQAISLIHQKLYKSSNVASINMSSYVSDMLEYLGDSFSTRKRNIGFEQIIEPLNLDLAQAVPLGLVLNEAVTNSIKYAFGPDGGQIIVALQLINEVNLLLTISDNGKGLPADFSLKHATSLGMEMMKALSKQLGGEFKIENKGGVRISIEFRVETVLPGLAESGYSRA